MDCCVTKLRNGTDLFMLQSIDFALPVVDDPYLQGRIACAHVLSNIYATGADVVDHVGLLFAVPIRMTEKERGVVFTRLMRGFIHAGREAGARVQGGQMLHNPWMSIGGMASTIASQRSDLISLDAAVPGDVLVLTKPLGTRVAVTAYSWLDRARERLNRVKMIINEDEIVKAFEKAVTSMTRLNKDAACLMRKFRAHAATDVAGYGILGHAQTLARVQRFPVTMTIHNLPVISKMAAVSRACGGVFGVTTGRGPETSGGLLIAIGREDAAAFCKEIERVEGHPAWIVGVVEKGDGTARVIDRPRIIDIPF